MRKRTLQLKKLLAVLLIFSIFSVCCTSAYAESTTSSTPAAQELAVAETEEVEPLALSTVPDAVGAEKALAAGHVKRLYSEENSPNEVVFENADDNI